MTGLELLSRLPLDVQAKIIAKYGSLEAYHQHVLEVFEADYAAHMQKDRAKQEVIRGKIYDLEDELESFGVDLLDADYILQKIREIVSDRAFLNAYFGKN